MIRSLRRSIDDCNRWLSMRPTVELSWCVWCTFDKIYEPFQRLDISFECLTVDCRCRCSFWCKKKAMMVVAHILFHPSVITRKRKGCIYCDLRYLTYILVIIEVRLSYSQKMCLRYLFAEWNWNKPPTLARLKRVHRYAHITPHTQ